MAKPKKRMSLLTSTLRSTATEDGSAATNGKARPHLSPLPRGEGETLVASRQNSGSRLKQAPDANARTVGAANGTHEISGTASKLPPLLGERAGVRADVAPASKLTAPDFLVWQLIDSAFPTGGFAHSAGLEAAWQHGEVRGRVELLAFAETSLDQLGHGYLPFVMATFDTPDKLAEFDQLCDAFTTNHVANRASRAQGRAFLTAVERIFPERRFPNRLDGNGNTHRADLEIGAPFAHFAPVFGACLQQLDIPRETTARMFFFNHLRSVLAAAVRLNITGPMEAQVLQHKLSAKAELVRQKCKDLTLEQIAQTAPLLDLWQGAQDRLYSRLFQS
jgi:urease accessory protein